ncbi:MAG TPA: hypothetical protein VKR83_21110, partial [Ktedonobacteraceae bacterium]|nr:hypothetical protein [Ktedonobacteraceae bacterium]
HWISSVLSGGNFSQCSLDTGVDGGAHCSGYSRLVGDRRDDRVDAGCYFSPAPGLPRACTEWES